jgi:hypothetical protein
MLMKAEGVMVSRTVSLSLLPASTQIHYSADPFETLHIESLRVGSSCRPA